MFFETRYRTRDCNVRGTCPLLEVADALLHALLELRHRLVQLSPDRLQLCLRGDELRRELVVARVEPISDRDERLELADVADLLVGDPDSDQLGDHLVQLFPVCRKRHRFDTLSIFLCRLMGYA